MFTRNFILILSGNIVLGSAMPMLIILGSLAGAWLAPQDWLATAPPSAQMLGGIAIASPISLFMGRFGRRAGFLLGALMLISGAVLAVFSLYLHNFILLCLAHAALGGALICINYFRFAASEAVAEQHRPQAISFTLASGLIAALIGPELFTYSKDIMAPIALAGAYAAMAALGFIGILPILGLNMPAPKTVQISGKTTGVRQIIAERPHVLAAIGIAALSQAIMVLLMMPTPLAMIGCGFGEDQAADVIRWHVVAMFLPGFFTGTLINRFGAWRIATLGLGLLVFSALVALSGLDLLNFYGALILLGLGWNFGFVSGTHLLQSGLSPEERPLVQGINDTILAISSCAASLLSGAFYAAIGWIGLSTLSIPLVLILSMALLYKTKRLSKAV